MTAPVQNTTAAPARGRKRKTAAWKAGLLSAGMGAVVLGAGYFAGVGVPDTQVAAALGAAAQGAGATAPAQAAPAIDDGSGSRLSDGQEGSASLFSRLGDDDQNEQDEQPRTFSRRRLRPQFSQDGTQALGQQPRFSGPVTRSRGS